MPLRATDGAAETLWVVMVPFTLPGERVRARVFRNHKNFSEADLVTVLTPSPHRIAASCPLFGRCGGCQYQHLSYAEQLAWKRRQVEELLQHMVGVTFPVAAVIGSPREFGYRSKITPHFAAPRAAMTQPATTAAKQETTVPGAVPDSGAANGGTATAPATTNAPALPIGFLRQGTRFEIVDVPQCPIATPAINARLTEVRAEVRARATEGAFTRGATLLLREASGAVTTNYEAVITETIELPVGPGREGEDKRGGTRTLRLQFLARDFFQNNPFILPAFAAYVSAQAAATGARFLVDAYCGSGLFALAAAPAFERVAGVELSATSIDFARKNAAANHITNANFLAADAAAIFAGLDFPATETAVIIDPPRKGCDEAFLQQLFAFGPRAVVYVSCDPATQMRDLKQFLAAGYMLTAVQPFDLFPQTRHLECVITLRNIAG
ncbi:class I SAM-dependent RNA methyltransferase [Horticoccus luteus]|uniref:Class I SAM-dependent RNA methyltransferase n=2 Tax=Horticoccus luteus TaxID=2862869 RepID=A0A8F9XN64_9BACT|nr:class I SAM-dependent RNA methyltransferase [Horticoccus luteus]